MAILWKDAFDLCKKRSHKIPLESTSIPAHSFILIIGFARKLSPKKPIL